MKNGYYLSTYTHIHPIAHLYQIDLRHDHHIALWSKQDSKIKLVHYWEFERRSGRKKHNLSFIDVKSCKSAINQMLKEYDLSLADMVEVWGTPGLETGTTISSFSAEEPYAYHSLCHLFSGMMTDCNVFYSQKILAFALDGGPDNVIDHRAREKNFYLGAYSDKGVIQYFSVPSPGVLWMFMKLRYALEEGSLMALGSAVNSTILNQETLMNDYPIIYGSNDINHAFEWFNSIAQAVEGIDVEEIIDFDNRFSEQDNRIGIIANIIQKISIDMLDHLVENSLEKFGLDAAEVHLSMSGGFTLNCPTNSYLMNKYNFQSFISCPCVSDTGIGLGMGLFEFYSRMKKIDFKFESAYYGDFEQLNIKGYENYIHSSSGFDEDQFVADIVREPVIWFNGRSEVGPRALGARSILGDPRAEKTKDILNDVKKRQWWRPVAPVIKEELQNEWFGSQFQSQYMLFTYEALPDKKNLIPAALHLDNSARLQTVSPDSNPDLYHLLNIFHQHTGVPIICNTSLNDAGEPIINTLEECINFALRKKIRVIYVNKIRLELQHHEQFPEVMPKKRLNFALEITDAEKELLKLQYNPFDLNETQLNLYMNMPELREFDITQQKDYLILKRILERYHVINDQVWKALQG
ncbi:carbamoyltransferase C-terminal domain-containing protein [Paenibacillus polymyxa]|uniref:carbamoyltransferase C-terminal domain-containing protein n=1 Tax=Paenibacillus polymyxa TaxID=1406 RepID=UPI002ED257DE|nr:carbamoyltransferase C-terminal domain-containing protein [Paenibacillus polymyxa]